MPRATSLRLSALRNSDCPGEHAGSIGEARLLVSSAKRRTRRTNSGPVASMSTRPTDTGARSNGGECGRLAEVVRAPAGERANALASTPTGWTRRIKPGYPAAETRREGSCKRSRGAREAGRQDESAAPRLRAKSQAIAAGSPGFPRPPPHVGPAPRLGNYTAFERRVIAVDATLVGGAQASRRALKESRAKTLLDLRHSTISTEFRGNGQVGPDSCNCRAGA